MRIRKWIMAAAIPIASLALPIATAGAAAASPTPPTTPYISGLITGLHTFILAPGETVVYGEDLLPLVRGYGSYVPVVGIYTSSKGVTTVTTGDTFLPLNKIGQDVTFEVVYPYPSYP